jgi:hypothetical protein
MTTPEPVRQGRSRAGSLSQGSCDDLAVTQEKGGSGFEETADRPEPYRQPRGGQLQDDHQDQSGQAVEQGDVARQQDGRQCGTERDGPTRTVPGRHGLHTVASGRVLYALCGEMTAWY